MTTDLKPCPFCGGAPYQGREIGETGELDWFVACGNYCGAACQTFDSQDEADQAWNRRAPTDESFDRISCALGLGAPAAPVDNMVTEIGWLRDGDRAQLRTLKDLTFLQGLVLEYFRVKKYAAEAWAPGGKTADRVRWANAETAAEEALRKAVMG